MAVLSYLAKSRVGDVMTEDDPITLKQACGLYPRAKLTVSTLRAEARRGRLEIFRLGRCDSITAEAMREMVRRCRV